MYESFEQGFCAKLSSGKLTLNPVQKDFVKAAYATFQKEALLNMQGIKEMGRLGTDTFNRFKNDFSDMISPAPQPTGAPNPAPVQVAPQVLPQQGPTPIQPNSLLNRSTNEVGQQMYRSATQGARHNFDIPTAENPVHELTAPFLSAGLGAMAGGLATTPFKSVNKYVAPINNALNSPLKGIPGASVTNAAGTVLDGGEGYVMGKNFQNLLGDSDNFFTRNFAKAAPALGAVAGTAGSLYAGSRLPGLMGRLGSALKWGANATSAAKMGAPIGASSLLGFGMMGFNNYTKRNIDAINRTNDVTHQGGDLANTLIEAEKQQRAGDPRMMEAFFTDPRLSDNGYLQQYGETMNSPKLKEIYDRNRALYVDDSAPMYDQPPAQTTPPPAS